VIVKTLASTTTMHNLVPLQDSTLATSYRVTEETSILSVWDFISGTSDERPFDEAYADKVFELLKTICPSRTPRVLDLGGGAGNPSIALARAGCRVTIVDSDAELLGAAERRSRTASADLRCELEDWLDFLVRAVDVGAGYDAIMFLGNSLGYQDSWPDRGLPKRRMSDSIAPTFDLCRKVLAPGGVIVVESPFEQESKRPAVYIRFHPPLADGGVLGKTSVWVVNCDGKGSARKVDTMVVVPDEGGVSRVQERIEFSGWLITRERLREAADEAGMHAEFYLNPLRPLFDVAVLRV
jgi:SAM-dependent methyltransferase